MASPSKRPRNTGESREDTPSGSPGNEMVPGFTVLEFIAYLGECNIFRCRLRREFEGVETAARIPEQAFTRLLRNVFRSWVNLHFSGIPEGTTLSGAEFIERHIAAEFREPERSRVIEEWLRHLRESSPVDQSLPPTLGSDLILSFDRPSTEVALAYEVLYRMADLTESQMEQRRLSPLILTGVAAGRIAAAGIDNRTLLAYFRTFLMLEARTQASKFMKLKSDEKDSSKRSKLSEVFKELKKPTHTDQKRKEPGPSKELGECSTSQSKAMDIDAKLPQAKSVMSSLDQKVSELEVKEPDPTKERGECSSAESGAKANVAELPQAKGGMPSPDQKVSEREGKELDPTKERGECGSVELDAKGADKPLQAEGDMPSSDQKVSEQEGKEPDSTEEHGECSSAESGAKASDAEKPLQAEGDMPSSDQKVSEQERKEPDPTK